MTVAVKRGQVRVVVAPVPPCFSAAQSPDYPRRGTRVYLQAGSPALSRREVARRSAGGRAACCCWKRHPVFESYRAAETGTLTRVTLPRRFWAAAPGDRPADLREEFKARRFAIPSPVLRRRSLAWAEEQVILSRNAAVMPLIICRECVCYGSAYATRTYHRRPNLLLCHYCGFRRHHECPNAGS